MTKPDRSIFSDRRNDNDRRQQSLSIPSRLDRRLNGRRSKQFVSEPWWLRIDYAVELVSEEKPQIALSRKPATQPHNGSDK